MPPNPSSARAARQFVADVLGTGEVVEMAVLLVSELASNAILHAGTEFEVCIAADDEVVRIDVSDSDRRVPRLKNYVARSVSGRGLHMIAASADRWGFEATTSGKVVWFELTRP